MGESPVCPESTIESANRRNFIRKAAIASAAVGIGASALGGTALGKAVLPASSADLRCENVIADANSIADYCAQNDGTSFQPGFIFADSTLCTLCSNPTSIASARKACSANRYGIDFWTGKCGVASKKMSLTQSGKLGIGTSNPSSTLCVAGSISASSTISAPRVSVNGNCSSSSSPTLCVIGSSSKASNVISGQGVVPGSVGVYGSGSKGVVGSSCNGPAVQGVSSGGVAICATSNFGPALYAQAVLPTVGKFKNHATCSLCDKSALAQFETGDSAPIDWNVGVAGAKNSLGITDGSFYFQRQGLSNIPIAINKCGYVGINNDNPIRRLCITGRIQASCGVGVGTQTIYTTLAVNGSISMKSRVVSTTPMTLAFSDFAVLANAASASLVLTLPTIASAAGACNGMMLVIKKIDSSTTHTVTIKPGGTDQIEGSTVSRVLTKQWDSLTLLSNNSTSTHQWIILSGSIGDAFVS